MFVFHSHNSVVSLYNNVANSVRRFVYKTVVLDKQKNSVFVKALVAVSFRNCKLKRLWNAKTTLNFRPLPEIKYGCNKVRTSQSVSNALSPSPFRQVRNPPPQHK